MEEYGSLIHTRYNTARKYCSFDLQSLDQIVRAQLGVSNPQLLQHTPGGWLRIKTMAVGMSHENPSQYRGGLKSMQC